MNARESENYLAISPSSSASKSAEICWAEIYRGRHFLRAESSLIQSNCRSLRNRNVFSMRRIFFYPSVCAAMFVNKS
jgi:hypothetical protein